MNLEESDTFKKQVEENTKRKRGIMLSIILCAILVVFLFVIIMILKYQDSITEKLFIDDKQVAIPENFYYIEDDTVYLNLREMAFLLGYTYTKGEYNKFNEDDDTCYLQNDFEIASMSARSDKYQKYVEVVGEPTLAEIAVTMKNENGYNETFTLKHPIKYDETNGMYASIEDVSEMLNVQIDWQEYRFRFYSLEYMVNYAKTAVGKFNITEMSGYYENLKSVLYGYVVVGNGSAETDRGKSLYGVVSLADGSEIISIKYDDIKFVQNVQEFYVTVSNGTMGILGADGSTIIAPSEYENISLLDDEAQLYLVEKDKKFGVVNRTGKTIIHAENDEIGLDITEFELEDIPNSSLLFDKVIPVKNGEKYGLYNTDGELVLGIVYDSLGYKVPETNEKTANSEQNVLVIPSSVGINGIVINLDGLYGVFDANTQEIILPCVYSKIYAITKSGETTYYMVYDGETRNLSEYLQERGLTNIDENGNYVENMVTQEETNTSNTEEDINSQAEENLDDATLPVETTEDEEMTEESATINS